jgi:4-amino-4-deoxy-L-arabinose transferase-like glycosyltransferase/membrane-associated phospholipid phosphatase
MHWFQSLDAEVFHWINSGLRNSFFDWLMPLASGNKFFPPALLLGAILLFCKGGARGRVFALMLMILVPLGDHLVVDNLKRAIQRPRPFMTLPDAHVPEGVGRTNTGSMPSGHSANWFAATLITFVYYRKGVRVVLPLALLVAFSRIYNGVHYPADVMAGAIVGMGYSAAGLWLLNQLWQWVGGRFFPLWHQCMPDLTNPVFTKPAGVSSALPDANDKQWLNLGMVLILALMIGNWIYIASGVVTLSEDEAYQWIWSKHLALSYYSKPLLIALTQYAGTHLWGDTDFGVRFFAPLIAGVTALAVMRFFARVANARTAFWLSLVLATVPLLSVGSTIMTIDPLSCMFWILAMIAGWDALQENGSLKNWFFVGLWMGLGFLSKYTALFQLASWALFFAHDAPSRKHLRRPGPWLALLVNALCTLPVVIWNNGHHWITVRHVAEGGHFDEPWAFTIANLWRGFCKYTLEFLGSETALQNPFYFLPVMWAVFAFWRRRDGSFQLEKYFFSMGAPIFAVYFLLTFHSRSLPNWIAPAIIPFFCLGMLYWEARWREGFQPVIYWLKAGLGAGIVTVLVLHNTDLVKTFTTYEIPANLDSTRRIKGWKETADVVEAARQKLSTEGKPVFIICGHYGIAGELTFNLPEARAHVQDQPLVYFQTSDVPVNQFYFWPGYHDRKGQNAIYVQETGFEDTNTFAPPQTVLEEFESASTTIGVMVTSRGKPMHRLLITELRGLK